MSLKENEFLLQTSRRINENNNDKTAAFVVSTKEIGGETVAQLIINEIQKHQTEKPFVLGLATGSSPIPIYQSLVSKYQNGDFSFPSNLITVNLDEYYPMKGEDSHSYRYFMNNHLFSKVNIDINNTHVPNGEVNEENVLKTCEEYEKFIDENGIDLQILGIGRDGHIGFNEPGSSIETVTRVITLHHQTAEDAAGDFGGIENVPKNAITMGVGSILKAKKIILVAWGEKKAKIIHETLNSSPDANLPATFLHTHPNSIIIVDQSLVDNASF